jgi:HrpA-like RNA helicase
MTALPAGDVQEFLGSAVNPPNAVSITASLEVLRSLQAIDEHRADALTPLGYHLASLPVDPRVGKMLLLGWVTWSCRRALGCRVIGRIFSCVASCSLAWVQ